MEYASQLQELIERIGINVREDGTPYDGTWAEGCAHGLEVGLRLVLGAEAPSYLDALVALDHGTVTDDPDGRFDRAVVTRRETVGVVSWEGK